VLLPDDLIDGSPGGVLSQMLKATRDQRGSVIAVEQVAGSEVSRYGIVDPEDDLGLLMRLRAVVEKPAPEDAPSNLAIVGRYILRGAILQTLAALTPGSGGEIQLTDALAREIDGGGVWAYRFGGKRFDCGNKQGFLTANIHFGLKHGH